MNAKINTNLKAGFQLLKSLRNYKKPMASGANEEDTSDEVSKWRYPPPDSPMYEILNFICEYDN